MGEVLGVGCTHFPPLLGKPENFTAIVRSLLNNPVVPEEARDISNWPKEAQHDWEHQVEEAYVHQKRLIDGFRKVREVIDDFNPDVVIIWGDDQYENFHDDLAPPFCVHCDEAWVDAQPLHRSPDNPWGEPTDVRYTWKGHHPFAKRLATEIIERDFPIPYSYRPLHERHGMAHAFANTLLYLDWDRKVPGGFPYPVIPIAVNAYGRQLVLANGALGHLRREFAGRDIEPMLGPPGPTPRSCFQLGKLVRDIVEEDSERVVLMASSSWSHSFLTKKTNWLFPDRETDRLHFEQLKAGQHNTWGELSNAEVEDAGGHEWKNWICLAGAMADRTPTIVDYVESWVFNSNKCFCYFEP